MTSQSATKSKRSTVACVYCRERKIKCDNKNDELPCERCKRAGKTCRYEPVSSASVEKQVGDLPIETSNQPIMNQPIMQVYQPPGHSRSTITQGSQWNNPDPPIDPGFQALHGTVDSRFEQPQGQSAIPRVSYQGTPSIPNSSYQPPHAYPVRDTYAGGNWPAQTGEPYNQPHTDHSPYAFIAPPPQGQGNFHGYWAGQPSTLDPTHLPDIAGGQPPDKTRNH